MADTAMVPTVVKKPGLVLAIYSGSLPVCFSSLLENPAPTEE